MNHRIYSITKMHAPHIEHVASINPALTPDGLHTEIALTKCGRAIHRFLTVDDTSRQYTDGSTFLVPCPLCYQ